MKFIRVNAPLKPEENAALVKLAERERRDPRAQAAVLIREGLERLNLLTRPTTHPQEVHIEKSA